MGDFEAVESGDGGFAAYVSRPPAPATANVLVLQEIFGLTPFIRGVCDWLAEHGYLAAAPDLFWRQRPGVVLGEDERERAMGLMSGLDEALALRDCEATIAHVRASSPGPTAALGYCLGGKLAYLLAARDTIDAAISYYGVGIHGALDLAAGLHTPLLLHLPLDDVLCPALDREKLVAAMRAAPGPVTMLEYPGAQHAFARLGGAPYDEGSAKRANQATLAFLDRSFAR